MNQKIIRATVAGLLIVGTSSLVWSASYTIDDCLRIAQEKSPDLRSFREKIGKADAQVSEVRGGAYPKVSLSAQYMWNDYTASSQKGATPAFLDPTNPAFDYSAAQAIGFLSESMAPAPWQLNAGVTVTQVLYAQGKISTGLKIAKENRSRMDAELEQMIRDLHRDVRALFAQSLYLEEAVATYDSSIAQAGRYRELAETMHATGMMSELDLLRAQVSEEDLRAGQQNMVASLQLLRNALLQKIGLDYDPDVRFEGSLDEEFPEVSLPEAIERALANRQELKQLDYAKRIQNELVSIEKGDNHPLLLLGGSAMKVGKGEEWNDIAMGTDLRVFLQAQWDIFSGFQTKHKVVQARSDLRELEIAHEGALRGIRLEVESLWASYREAVSRLPVRVRQEELSKKALNIAEKSWQVGQATQLELLDAQLGWRAARLEMLKAQMDAQNAYRALAAAQGLW